MFETLVCHFIYFFHSVRVNIFVVFSSTRDSLSTLTSPSTFIHKEAYEMPRNMQYNSVKFSPQEIVCVFLSHRFKNRLSKGNELFVIKEGRMDAITNNKKQLRQ
jgi:hypothetical protein